MKTVSSDEIRVTVHKYFTSYFKRSQENNQEEGQEATTPKAPLQPDFATIMQYVEETTATAEDIVYQLLQSVYEEKYEVIQQYLPKIVGDIIGAQNWKLASGVSKFVQELSDLCADAPRLPEWFFNLVLKPMLDAKKFELRMIKWMQPEDEIYALGGHFEVFAYLI